MARKPKRRLEPNSAGPQVDDEFPEDPQEDSLASESEISDAEAEETPDSERSNSSSPQNEVGGEDEEVFVDVNGKKIKWKNVGKNLRKSRIEFRRRKGRVYIPNHSTKMEAVSKCFLQFFTEEMLILVVVESNKYAEKMVLKYKWAKRVVKNPITLVEMKQYLGTRLAIGLRRSGAGVDCYRQSFPYDFIRERPLGRDRFQDINASLHCQEDKEEDQPRGRNTADEPNYDVSKEPKIGKLLKMFMDACRGCKQYILPKQLTLDEMMILFQGSCYKIFRRQAKPTSMGMKIIAITDYTGFLVCFIIDPGPGRGIPVHSMVLQLAAMLNNGHELYMDNYYCTVKIAVELILKYNIMVTGTVRQNRGVPPETKFDTKKEQQGKFKYCMVEISESKSIVAGHWFDSRLVGFLSTAHNGNAGVVERRKKGHVGRREITAPECMVDYNKYMHGNDRADQKRTSYSIQMKSRKWWKAFFNWIFDSACINAHLLLTQQGDFKIPRKEFMILLCRWLCGLSEEETTHDDDMEIVTRRKRQCTVYNSSSVCDGVDHRLQPTSKLVGKRPGVLKQGKCALCLLSGEKKKVEFFCLGCDEYYHLDCYFEHHSDV